MSEWQLDFAKAVLAADAEGCDLTVKMDPRGRGWVLVKVPRAARPEGEQ